MSVKKIKILTKESSYLSKSEMDSINNFVEDQHNQIKELKDAYYEQLQISTVLLDENTKLKEQLVTFKSVMKSNRNLLNRESKLKEMLDGGNGFYSYIRTSLTNAQIRRYWRQLLTKEQ